MRRRRRCACARTGRRWSAPAVAATIRRPGPDVESDKLLARTENIFSPSIFTPTRSPAAICGGGARAIRPKRRCAARTRPARPRPLWRGRRASALPPLRRLRSCSRCCASGAVLGSYDARGRAGGSRRLRRARRPTPRRTCVTEAGHRPAPWAGFVVKASGSSRSKAALEVRRRT